MTLETEPRKTVGQISTELLAKGDQKQGVIETQQEMMKNYNDELIKCALEGKEIYGTEKIFYICVQTRRERLLSNVIRNMFYTRQTRPRPAYDLALYHFEPKSEQLRFVWCIPDQETVQRMIDPMYIPTRDEMQLHEFCQWFEKGVLV